MARLCDRPGCDRPAAARLGFDPVSCSVWLDPLLERPGRSQEICDLHAERLTVPRGWMLCDQRTWTPEPEPEPPAVEPETEPEPEPEPERRSRRRMPTSPLLARAFAANGPQQSVLTQGSAPLPDDEEEEVAP